jgi:hypothetical protein
MDDVKTAQTSIYPQNRQASASSLGLSHASKRHVRTMDSYQDEQGFNSQGTVDPAGMLYRLVLCLLASGFASAVRFTTVHHRCCGDSLIARHCP